MNLLYLLQTTPALFVSLCIVLGLMVGSFLNVVIHRLPRMMEQEWQAQCAELRGEAVAQAPRFNLAAPRSACPACGHRITALQNIPLLSYLVLRGRCAACGQSIPIRYPVVEAASGLLTGFVAWKYGLTLTGAGAMVFAWAAIALTAIDLDTQLLPDGITLPLLWTGLLLNLGGAFTDIRSAVIGAAAGYLVLWSVYWTFKLATGKEGMGYGDFKLLSAIGAWLGWKMLPLVILLSSAVGAAVGVGLMVFARHGRNTPIPFGPYLAVAGLIALFWGEPILKAYLG